MPSIIHGKEQKCYILGVFSFISCCSLPYLAGRFLVAFPKTTDKSWGIFPDNKENWVFSFDSKSVYAYWESKDKIIRSSQEKTNHGPCSSNTPEFKAIQNWL